MDRLISSALHPMEHDGAVCTLDEGEEGPPCLDHFLITKTPKFLFSTFPQRPSGPSRPATTNSAGSLGGQIITVIPGAVGYWGHSEQQKKNKDGVEALSLYPCKSSTA